VIRVRVCAPLELRIRRMMERLATDNRETVEAEILLSEEAHTAITRRHFGVNWRDAEHYDVVLSTERLSVEECVDEVESVMRKAAFQETPASLRMVDNLSLEWSIRAALRRDTRTQGMSLKVLCDAGMVTLDGVVDTDDQARDAEQVAAATDGVRGVRNLLRPGDVAAYRYRREG
jgi:hypothetical protein